MPRILLIILLWCWLAPAAVAEPRYRLIQGELWQGVVIGGQPPRTRDQICRQQQCYPIDRLYPLSDALLRRHGLLRYHFDNLAQLPEVTRQGNQLWLPSGLGWPLYRDARRDAWRQQKERSGLLRR